MDKATNKIALVLTGGGARAAYQVGALKALAELLPGCRTSPFQIICGSSAGAINAAALACHASSFKLGVRRLERVWGHFTSGQIYRTNLWGMTLGSVRWLAALFRPGPEGPSRRALMDNTPMRQLLSRIIRFDRIERALAKGHLSAVSVTCSGYSSRESVSFFEGTDDLQPWRRQRRSGVQARIQLDHLMASSAIPLLFSPVKIHREYFGDGSVGLLSPLSPALHLGADRVMVIGVADTEGEERMANAGKAHPTIAEVAGHVLDSVFIDSLGSDLENLERVNRTLDALAEGSRPGGDLGLKHVDTLVLSPSRNLASLAGKHVAELSATARFFFRRIGVTELSGSVFLSYLLFEAGYTRELMALGYADTLARKDEVLRFFAPKFEAPAPEPFVERRSLTIF